MKKTITLIIATITICSCQYKVDNTDPFKVGEAFFEGITKKDTTILNQILICSIDSLPEFDAKMLSKAMSSFNEDEPVQLIKIDTSTTEVEAQTVIDVYIKQGDQIYSASTLHVPNESHTIKIKTIFFNNATERCEEYNKNVYSPKDLINFNEIHWTYSNVRRFDSGTVSLENNTLEDINYIKFRVILKRGQYWWDAETFFNQTVESYKTIYKGDLATVDVPGMRDYYTGFNINNENIFLAAELIEVGPKPISYWCKILNELKNEKK